MYKTHVRIVSTYACKHCKSFTLWWYPLLCVYHCWTCQRNELTHKEATS